MKSCSVTSQRISGPKKSFMYFVKMHSTRFSGPENIIYCLYYDKFPITGGTNPGVYYLSSVMVFSDGFSDTQNKLDPNWSINYLLLQNIVTATEIHNGNKKYFVTDEDSS